ncbi:hypothetical protein ACVIN2_002706 [Bradyrhizobium sp. USDA 3650]
MPASGEVGRPGLELDPVDIKPEFVGRNLRKRRPGALPHVMRADFHGTGAVAAKHGTRFGLEHQCREGRGTHAPADQKTIVVAHLPRLERSLRPAEARGALLVAGAQRLGRERFAGDGLDLGIVLQTKGERIDAAGPSHLVDRAFQGDRAGRLAGRAHEQRRAGVDAHGVMRGADRRRRIERVRGIGRGLVEIVERARHGARVVIERCQAPLAIGTDAQPLPRRRAMADRAIHLLAAQHQLDRFADELCRHDAEDRRAGHEPLRAEPTAEERAADVDLVVRDAEQFGDARQRQHETLGRHVDLQTVTVPGRHDRMRLHCVVILRRRLVRRVDPLVC